MKELKEFERMIDAGSMGFNREMAVGGSSDPKSMMVVLENGKTRCGDVGSSSDRLEVVEDLAVCDKDFPSPLNSFHPCSSPKVYSWILSKASELKQCGDCVRWL